SRLGQAGSVLSRGGRGRGRQGRWDGLDWANSLEVTHCGPARVSLSERSHTTEGTACYALSGGSSAWGDQHGSARPDAKISSGIRKEAQGVRVRARAEA